MAHIVIAYRVEAYTVMTYNVMAYMLRFGCVQVCGCLGRHRCLYSYGLYSYDLGRHRCLYSYGLYSYGLGRHRCHIIMAYIVMALGGHRCLGQSKRHACMCNCAHAHVYMPLQILERARLLTFRTCLCDVCEMIIASADRPPCTDARIGP